PGQALVAVVGVHGGGHGGARVGTVRIDRARVVARAPGGELRVLVGRQLVGGDAVGAGPVQRVPGRVAERAAEAAELPGSGERGDAAGGAAGVGAQVVLAEVVGQGALAEVDGAAGLLAGLDQPAALVEEGPQLELGPHARYGGAGVVDHGAEVAQHAERVGRAPLGDVPDSRLPAAGPERVEVAPGVGGLRAFLGDHQDVGAGAFGHGEG